MKGMRIFDRIIVSMDGSSRQNITFVLPFEIACSPPGPFPREGNRIRRPVKRDQTSLELPLAPPRTFLCALQL